MMPPWSVPSRSQESCVWRHLDWCVDWSSAPCGVRSRDCSWWLWLSGVDAGPWGGGGWGICPWGCIGQGAEAGSPPPSPGRTDLALLAARGPAELLLQLERRHGLLRPGALFLPRRLRLRRPEPHAAAEELRAGLHHGRVSRWRSRGLPAWPGPGARGRLHGWPSGAGRIGGGRRRAKDLEAFQPALPWKDGETESWR